MAGTSTWRTSTGKLVYELVMCHGTGGTRSAKGARCFINSAPNMRCSASPSESTTTWLSPDVARTPAMYPQPQYGPQQHRQRQQHRQHCQHHLCHACQVEIISCKQRSLRLATWALFSVVPTRALRNGLYYPHQPTTLTDYPCSPYLSPTPMSRPRPRPGLRRVTDPPS